MHPAEIARTEYLTHYRSVIARERPLHEKFSPEVLLELSERAGLHRRLFRVDMAATDNGKHSVIEANLDRAASLPVRCISLNGVSVTVHPFVWNGAVFCARVAGPLELDAWFDRWADLEEKNGSDADGLGGMIHSLYVKDRGDGFTEYSIDFGSAPVGAFDDFIGILAASGATEIEISSSHYEEKDGEPDGADNSGADLKR